MDQEIGSVSSFLPLHNTCSFENLFLTIVYLSTFSRHLDQTHSLDEKTAAQARVQGYAVKELEERVRTDIVTIIHIVIKMTPFKPIGVSGCNVC